jgi:hypothetical protein
MDTDTCLQDVMLVCRNGHVITDLLHTYPERGQAHCGRCGATTLDHCPTCGHELPGAVAVPGLVPVGRPQPPHYCERCGAAFPWAQRPPAAAAAEALARLETLLRRLPRVIRQLRTRHGDRPPFRVTDEFDLEDLLRALLPLQFDDVRPENRTPTYAQTTRTDFLLAPEAIAITAKRVTPELRANRLAEQLREDAAAYARQPQCRTLIGFVYDPEEVLVQPRQLEQAWSQSEEALEVRCVIAS